MPFYDSIRVYFCVDHRYVLRKLGLLIFPFIRVSSPPVKPAHVPSGSADYAFSGGPVPPQSNFGGTSPGAQGVVSDKNTASISPINAPLHLLPIHNVLAFDLYIPLMGILSYVVFSLFTLCMLMNVGIPEDYFYITCRNLAACLLAEVGLLRAIGMIPNFSALQLDFLMLFSLMGYKYVLITLSIMILFAIGPTPVKENIAIVYSALASGVFGARALRNKNREKECKSSFPLIIFSAVLVALVQCFTIWWSIRTVLPV